MAFESFLRRAEKTNDAKVGRAPVEAAGPSLPELVDTDPEFNLYLENLGGGRSNAAMWLRYKEGKTNEVDMPKINSQYKQFLERKKNATELLSTLDDYTEDMVQNSIEFRDLSNMNGAENVRQVLQQGLRERVMKDPAGFTKIQAEYKKLKDFEETVEKPLDKRIKDWCEKRGIPEDEDLRKALLESNGIQRQKAIQHHLLNTMSARGVLFDWVKSKVGYGTYAHSRELAKEDLPALIAQREMLTKNAGAFSRDLLVKDKTFREALSRARLGEEPTFPEGAETRMTMQEASGKIKKPEVYAAWGDFLTGKGVVDFSKEASTAQDDLRDEFKDQYEDNYFKDKKGGFWQAIARILFGKSLDKIDLK